MHKVASIAQRYAEISGEIHDVSANLLAAPRQFSLTCDLFAILGGERFDFLTALEAADDFKIFFSYVTGPEYASK